MEAGARPTASGARWNMGSGRLHRDGKGGLFSAVHGPAGDPHGVALICPPPLAEGPRNYRREYDLAAGPGRGGVAAMRFHPAGADRVRMVRARSPRCRPTPRLPWTRFSPSSAASRSPSSEPGWLRLLRLGRCLPRGALALWDPVVDGAHLRKGGDAGAAGCPNLPRGKPSRTRTRGTKARSTWSATRSPRLCSRRRGSSRWPGSRWWRGAFRWWRCRAGDAEACRARAGRRVAPRRSGCAGRHGRGRRVVVVRVGGQRWSSRGGGDRHRGGDPHPRLPPRGSVVTATATERAMFVAGPDGPLAAWSQRRRCPAAPGW